MVVASTSPAAADDAPPLTVGALVAACREQSVDAVEKLLARAADAAIVDRTADDGDTPLAAACRRGRADVAQALMAFGASADVAKANGATPLYIAARLHHLRVLELLLANGARVDAADARGANALMVAAFKGHADVVELLVERGVTVDASDVKGETALMIAAQHGHRRVVELLLARGASVVAKNVDGATPLLIAAAHGRTEVAETLVASGASVHAADAGGATPLVIAAQRGHRSVVEALLDRGARIDAADANGATALHVAAEHGRAVVVTLLIAKGAGVDAPDARSGATPLFVAAQCGHKTVVDALLARGARVEATVATGETALHAAAARGHKVIATVLLSHSARADATSADGATPVHAAAARGHRDVVDLLVKNGASVVVADSEGVTPLHAAAQHDHKSAVKLLLSRGADVNASDARGATALLVAAQRGHRRIVDTLLARGASVDTSDVDGATPLYAAAAEGHVSVVSMLLARGASVECVNSNGSTPLHIAAQNGDAQVIQTLLAPRTYTRAGSERHDSVHSDSAPNDGAAVSSANLEMTDTLGDTPLLVAARAGRSDVVKLLLRAGASSHARNADGATLLVYSARRGDASIVPTLLDLNCLAPQIDAEQRGSLLAATLQTLTEYASQTHEFQDLWTRVVDRLVRLHSALDCVCDDLPRERIFQLVMLVFHLVQLKAACSSSNVFARLVASAMVAAQFRDIQTELSYLKLAASIETHRSSAASDWQAQSSHDEMALLRRFRETIAGRVATHGESAEKPGGDMMREAAFLLQHKLTVQGDACSADLQELLKLSLRAVLEAADLAAPPSIPDWFIPLHELLVDTSAFAANASSSTTTVTRGRWWKAAIMTSRADRSAFVESVDACYRLSHPNVVQVFGASHLQHPCVAVLEGAASMNLREYLKPEERKHERWQRLFEVSLGFKYLLERGVVLANLRCDDIWIGSDGVAKICALQCLLSAAPSGDPTEFTRWQSPESARGESLTAASSVYTLGICALEALTRELPWGSDESDLLALSRRVSFGWRPQLPRELSDEQKNLFTQMWRVDPLKRPTIASVALQLEHFANETRSEHSLRRWPSLEGDGSASSLAAFETVLIPELGTTSRRFIQENLRWKCRQCRESPEAVAHIFQRVCDLFGVMQAQHRRAGDVAAARFSDLLVRLDRFLRTAVSDKSVLQLARSQKVSLNSHVFHRRLDELLELLAPTAVDPIHEWRTLHDESDRDGESAVAASNENKEAGVPTDRDAVGTRHVHEDAAVEIVRLDANRLNARFGRMDVAPTLLASSSLDEAGNDSVPKDPSLPWLVHTYDLVYGSSDRIGVGAFGEVFKATWLGTPVVVKFMGYEADGSANSRDLFFHELRVWFPLSHPHVIKLFGASHVGKRFFVCEYAGGGSLVEFVAKSAANAARRWELLYQTSLGLRYLHDQSILHNDLKGDNVLIGATGDAKIIDFGLSSILKSAEVRVDPKRLGAVQWRSPESIRGDRLTLASDVYAFAMCVLETVSGEPPWGRSTLDALVRFRVKKGLFPARPAAMRDSAWNVVRMMCAPEPTQRVTMAFVVEKLHQLSQQHAAQDQTAACQV